MYTEKIKAYLRGLKLNIPIKIDIRNIFLVCFVLQSWLRNTATI